MHPPPPLAAAMDFSQNSLFGYMEDLQELTIIERPVRRSLKVRPGVEELPAGRPAACPCPDPRPSAPRGGPGPSWSPPGPPSPPSVPGPRVTLTWPLSGPLPRRPPGSPSLDPPTPRDGHPGPARDPSDALGSLIPPAQLALGPFPSPSL